MNHLDLAPNFAGTLFGVASGVGSVSSWLAPLTIGTLTDGQQTLARWRIALSLVAGVWLTVAVIFLVFGSSEEQPWNQPAVASAFFLANSPAIDSQDSPKNKKELQQFLPRSV